MGALKEFEKTLKVKVTKNFPDGRVILCGEPVQVDESGNEFFVIPQHQAEYIKTSCPGWTVSEEFVEKK